MNDNSLLVITLIFSFIGYIYLFRKALPIKHIQNTNTQTLTYDQLLIREQEQEQKREQEQKQEQKQEQEQKQQQKQDKERKQKRKRAEEPEIVPIENNLLPLWTKEFEQIVVDKGRPDTDMRDISMREWKINMNENIARPNMIDYQREYEEGVDGNVYKNISKGEHEEEVMKNWNKGVIRPD